MNGPPKFYRRKLIIHKDLQIKFCAFILVTAVASSMMTSLLIGFRNRNQELENVEALSFLFSIGMVILLSLWTVIGLYFTNRIFGPLYRVHLIVKALLRDEKPPTPIKLREGDHMQDLISDFNALVEKIVTEKK